MSNQSNGKQTAGLPSKNYKKVSGKKRDNDPTKSGRTPPPASKKG